MERTPTFGEHEMTLLAGADIMTGLEHDEAAALRACATVRLCDPHEILFEEGEKAAYFYCVLSGYVRLYRSNGDNRFADIRICEPGDSFAECLVTDGGDYRYGAQAMEHSIFARFNLEQVRALVEHRPHIEIDDHDRRALEKALCVGDLRAIRRPSGACLSIERSPAN